MLEFFNTNEEKDDNNEFEEPLRLSVDNKDARFETSNEISKLEQVNVVKIQLFNSNEFAGEVIIEQPRDEALKKEYIQLTVIEVPKKYQGGNAAHLLRIRALDYAESLGKKLLFGSCISVPAYKNTMKLDGQEFKIIKNPEAVFFDDTQEYIAPRSWVLRIERNNTKK